MAWRKARLKWYTLEKPQASETAETELKDVHYRWDFNDLNGKDGKGNLTDSEKSTKSYTLKDGLITLTDRTTDFVMDQGFELADTYDWSIEWKAQLDNASSLFGTTASANNFVYLAYNVASWSNPVRITTDAGTFRYDIFAAYEAAVDSPTYQVFFSGEGSMQSFLNSCLERSVLNTGIVPTTEDSVITLSTCTGAGYDTRWVVQAVRRG